MTMDAMVAYLKNRGFEATKKYDPIHKKYIFTISKDGHSLADTFEYPALCNQVLKDAKQRAFLDGIIERFGLSSTLLDRMTEYLMARGFEVERSYRYEMKAFAFRITRDDFNLVRNFAWPHGLPDEVKEKVALDFLNSMIGEFEHFEKEEKEKKMSNNITWTVENITVDRRDNPYDKGSIKAELTGTPNGYVGAGSINDVVENLQKKLNDPGYIDTDRVAMAIVGGRQNGKTLAQFNMYRKLLLGNDRTIPSIQKVIFNKPATIVFWADDTKTVVKAQNNEAYDPEKGLAMAITKKALGDKGSYFNEIKKWTDKYEECEQK